VLALVALAATALGPVQAASAVIRDIQAQEGMGAAASTRALTRETHLFGGAGLQAPGQSAQVTETLCSGTYYLLDIAAIFAHKTPTVKALHVYGSPAPRASRARRGSSRSR
jgi:hypothetical protein